MDNQVVQRLIKAGFTVQIGPSPETQALRMRVWKNDGPGVTRFASWLELDSYVDRGEARLQCMLREIERVLLETK